MASAIENALRTATRAVAKAIGPKGNVLRRVITSYDEETQSDAVESTDYPVEILPVAEYGTREVDGQNVLLGDVKISLPAKGLPTLADGSELIPSSLTDKIVLNGVEWKIIRVGFVTGGVIPAMHVMQCRK